MCYGGANYACVNWCGPCPLVGGCWQAEQYCKAQGGRASIYQLLLISDDPLYCKELRESGGELKGSYHAGGFTYTYTGDCPTTDRYKRLWRTMCGGPACSNRDRITTNVDRVEVYMKTGGLNAGECGSGNWWFLAGCSDDAQAVVKAYDKANPIAETTN